MRRVGLSLSVVALLALAPGARAQIVDANIGLRASSTTTLAIDFGVDPAAAAAAGANELYLELTGLTDFDFQLIRPLTPNGLYRWNGPFAVGARDLCAYLRNSAGGTARRQCVRVSIQRAAIDPATLITVVPRARNVVLAARGPLVGRWARVQVGVSKRGRAGTRTTGRGVQLRSRRVFRPRLFRGERIRAARVTMAPVQRPSYNLLALDVMRTRP